MKQLYYVIRTLLYSRGSNLIKILSLGLALTMSVLLFARVAFELSHDTCFKEADRLQQIFAIWTTNGERSEPYDKNMGPVAGAILENFPREVEAATSVCDWIATPPLYNGSVRFDDAKIMADSLFFKTMGIEVLAGNTQDLVMPDVVFLSHRFARKIFNTENPIGKVLMFNKEIPLTVKGVYAALPDNTTLPCEAVISMPSMWVRQLANYSWNGGDSFKEYIRLRPGIDAEAINSRLDAMIQKYMPPGMAEMNLGYTAITKPIRDVYRNQEDVKRMVNIMMILGIAILFIAILNYVLMAISSLAYRAKAVGVHKCNGASGGSVFGMFLLETGIIIALSVVLMLLLLFNFRDFVEDTTAARLTALFAPERLWVPVAAVLLLFLVGGVLPGRIFSGIPVTQVFRRYTEGKKGWKRPLLFVQFVGVSFIAGLMCVVMAQYNYVIHKDVGYNPQRIAVSNTDFNAKEDCSYALAYFKGLPYIEEVSASSDAPNIYLSGEGVKLNGKSLFSSRFVSNMDNYPAMMGMTLKEGRFPSDYTEVAVNETFAKRMNWGTNASGQMNREENASGQVVGLDGAEGMKVVGVFKDYHTGSFYVEQQPLVIHLKRNFTGCLHVRLKEPFAENLAKLNKGTAEAFPNKAVEFYSLEQSMVEQYNAVRVFRNGTLISSVTMVLIMLMGLIGYTTDEVYRRSKEIAIRKVNGAEASDILGMLSRDVLYVALPAVIIGMVGSWYTNGFWMDLFAEQVTVSGVLYVGVGAVVLAIIVGCVLWRSWSIANENPVNSVKSE